MVYVMKKFYDLMNEATVTGGYPDSGIGGPCTDDDLPPGTTVFGDKMVPVEVPNRLTGKTIKYVPADEVGTKWDYDEFEHSQPMGAYNSYSDTLDGLSKILGDRLWRHTKPRTAELSPDKEMAYKDSEVDQEEKPKPTKGEETLDIKERIDRYLGVQEEEILNEEVVDVVDRKMVSRAIMSGKTTKVKIKSLGIDAVIRNDGEEVVVVYPKNEDFTLSLVDIADALGYKFNMGKSGNKQEFVIYID